jgi:diamine N-acetyltransferase
MLKSDRILLRAVEPKDLDYLFQAENDMQIWNLSSTLIPFSRRTLKDYANSIHDLATQKQFRYIIELSDSRIVIGMVDLFDYDAVNARAGVGIIISEPNERNKGYALESLRLLEDYARKTLHLNQLYCSMHASNASSIKLFQKLGYIQVGVRKNWFKVNPDKWEDEIEFQLLLNSKL